MKKFTPLLLALAAAFLVSQASFAQPGPRFGKQNNKNNKGNAFGHNKKDSTATDSTRTHRGGFGGFGWGHSKKDSTATDSTRNHRGGFGHAFGHGGFGKGQGHQGFGHAYGKGHRGGFGFGMKADSFYVDNTVYVGNVSAAAGATTAVLPVILTNDSIIKSVYFSLQLPEGITLAKDDEGKYMVQLNADRATEAHKVIAMPNRKGVVTFRLSSQTDAYVGNTGAVAFVTLNLDATLQEGEYTIGVTNLGVKDANDKRHSAPDATATLTIGANAVKSVADATAIQSVGQQDEAPRFDLNGRSVKSATRNVYIQNGKKYLKK